MLPAPPRRSSPSDIFTVFRRYGTIALLDDNVDFLESLSMALPEDWLVRTFVSAKACVGTLTSQIPHWNSELEAYRQMVKEFASDTELLRRLVDYWERTPARWAQVDGLVSDYKMPEMNGAEVLKTLRFWPGFKVMLTGGREEEAALEAFNSGALDRYQRKYTPGDPLQTFRSVFAQYREIPPPMIANVWETALPAEAADALRDPATKQALAEATASWAEFVVLSQPFGVVGSTPKGDVWFLQLELPSELEFLADVGRDAGLTAADIEGIRAGSVLPDVGVAYYLRRKPVAQPASRMGQFIGAATQLTTLPVESTLAYHLNASTRGDIVFHANRRAVKHG